MTTQVWYHANCNDGFCAAWVLQYYYFMASEPVQYIPVQYGQPPPTWICPRDPAVEWPERLFIVDFSYPRATMEDIAAHVKELVVLDHHESAAKELEGLPYCTFDTTKSGGRLAWEYTLKHNLSGIDPLTPWLVDYTEDRDLWRFNMPGSREVSAALASYPKTFELWNDWLLNKRGPKSFVEEGAAILRYQQTIIDAHVSHAVEVKLGEHEVLAVNATTCISEIAGKLAEGRPYGLVWFIREDGKVVHSLRSTKDGVNVSEVAQKYGGGGHKQAAGFEAEDFQGIPLVPRYVSRRYA